MRFAFTEDQLLLRDTLRDFLAGECTPERLRELWETGTARSPVLWSQLAELGVPGLLAPTEHGGLGLDEIDGVLLFEEAGRAALAEPVVGTAAVGVPLLASLPDPAIAAAWLPKVAAGAARLAVGHPVSPFVEDAHVAGLLLLCHGDEIHAVEPGAVELTAQPANDPSRKLFSVAWTPVDATRVAAGSEGTALQADALDRGALACAAQQLGVTDRLVALAVDYARQRQQFGKPIGAFQAVKHQLADVQVRLDYARPLVHRAAHSVARGAATRSADVSMAKIAASEAAQRAAKTALQVHGALGYTWEQDVHLWMRRAWSLEIAWGRSAWHARRVAEALLEGAAPVESFGFEPRT